MLWLDSDMVATPMHVQLLSHLLSVAPFCGRILHAVTGIYCKRGVPGVLTVRKQTDETELFCDVRFPVADSQVRLWPVIAGMGCLLQTRESFLGACEAVPDIRGNGPVGFPAITASGACQDSSGRWGWASEDQAYCQLLWQLDYRVYAVPIKFAHMSLVPLIPAADAVWLNAECSSESVPEEPPVIDPPAPTERENVAF